MDKDFFGEVAEVKMRVAALAEQAEGATSQDPTVVNHLARAWEHLHDVIRHLNRLENQRNGSTR